MPPKKLDRRTLGSSTTTTPLMVLELGGVRVSPDGITIAGAGAGGVESRPIVSVSIDRLRPVRVLGKGAHGEVSLYENPSTGEQFAVKRMQIRGSADMRIAIAEIRAAFYRHVPFVIRLHNAYFRRRELSLLMEYMDGGSLEELLANSPRLSEAAAAHVASSLLSGLCVLHEKQPDLVVGQENRRQTHRDIKPPNVMLNRSGDVKLADFGSAGSADSLGGGTFVGTAAYMSPERIRGQSHTTSSDIWSVGIVVAQALLGQFPLQATSFMPLLREVTDLRRLVLNDRLAQLQAANPIGGAAPRLSDAAQAFIDRCLVPEADERGTAVELLEHPWIVSHRDTGKAALMENVKLSVAAATAAAGGVGAPGGA